MPRWRVDSTFPVVLLLRRQGAWHDEGLVGCAFGSCSLVKYERRVPEDLIHLLSVKGYGSNPLQLALYFVESIIYFVYWVAVSVDHVLHRE